MSGFEELQLGAGAVAVLERWGWRPSHPLVREAVPTVARGHNLVAVTPPSPASAAPVVAAFVQRLGPEAPGLLVAPAAELALWGGIAQTVATSTGVRAETATSPARALRRLRSGSLDLLITTPATALALVERSALKPEHLAALLLAHPEQFAEHAALAPLMQDAGRETQRVIVAADAASSADLIERYARKALVVGALLAEPAPAPLGPVRTAHVSWSGRAAALADLLAQLDPETVTIWAADLSDAEQIGRAVPVDGDGIRLVTGSPTPADLIIAWDLPSRATLAELMAAGETVLLVPPGTESYADRIAQPQRPLRLTGVADAIAQEAAHDRAAIQAELERAELAPALLSLAPLFERVDAVRVAAALYNLWREGARPRGREGTPSRAGAEADDPRALPPSRPSAYETAPTNAKTGPVSKVFVSIGKRDGVTPADIVGALTRELRVDRLWIGRIELRDNFCLVELPAAEAERIAQMLSGITIRRVRVSARLDKGGRPGRGEGESGRGRDRGDSRRPRPRPRPDSEPRY